MHASYPGGWVVSRDKILGTRLACHKEKTDQSIEDGEVTHPSV